MWKNKEIMIFRISIVTAIICYSLSALGEGGRCYKIYDPHENFNRKVFRFNRAVDRSFIRPLVKGYHKVVPEWGKQRVNSFFYNIKEPLSFVNYIIQGNPKQANRTFWRFFVNTIFGIGGLFDFASKFDLNVEQQTFSKTLTHYGHNYGMYMVMPLLGPFTTRELYGKVIDTFTDPVSAVFVYQYDGIRLEYGAATAVQSRVKNDQILDDIEDTSIDSYSKTRSLYIQLLAGRNPVCEQEEEVINYD
ncbi:MAG: VacJ family lipoprotein [Rickettsiales bacterium]|nr:VacJ family lipoprotein [Rickettsiales bacterium]